MARKGFILFHDYAEQFYKVSDEQCGRLIKAIFRYELTGELPKLSPRADAVFGFVKNSLDENKNKYEDICKKRSVAGKKGGLASATSKYGNCLQMQANQANTNTNTNTNTSTNTNTENNGQAASPWTAAGIPSDTPPTLQKTARGEFHNVFLADEEYAKLVSEYGSEKAKGAVELLSTRIARDNKYKDENHFATIKAWVIRAYEEQNQKKKSSDAEAEKAAKEEKMRASGFDFEFEDIFEKP